MFGCFTGLRFSDYNNVKADNLVNIDSETFIRLITKKIGNEVIIPAHTVIQEIFEKYSKNANKLAKSFSNQKLNEQSRKLQKQQD